MSQTSSPYARSVAKENRFHFRYERSTKNGPIIIWRLRPPRISQASPVAENQQYEDRVLPEHIASHRMRLVREP
jgi:hypothetical protein